MRLTDQISTTSVDEERGTCKLVLNGHPVSLDSANDFDGTTIDGQYACAGSRYLVCLSYGIGWDDALNIYLLDSNGKVLDAMTGGGLMSIGLFKARECGDHTLDFTFFSDDTISRLTVSPHPGLHFLSPAPWRYRNLLRRHYLSLKEILPGGHHVRSTT